MEKSGSTIGQVNGGVGVVVDRAREAVKDGLDSLKRTFDDVGYFARRRYRQARKKVSRLYGDAPDYMSDNPSWSLLIAAGIGFFTGRVVRRRGAATGGVVTTRPPRSRCVESTLPGLDGEGLNWR